MDSKISEVRSLPFDHFADFQAAVAEKRFAIGIDPLAAARWANSFSSRVAKTTTTALSVLLVAAGLISVIAAIYLKDYWLLLAVPIQAIAFYFSTPASPLRSWVTLFGIASVLVFANLLLNHMTTAATLVAYCVLTFSAVRAAGVIANVAFRRALMADEELFVAAFTNGACTIRDNTTERVYAV